MSRETIALLGIATIGIVKLDLFLRTSAVDLFLLGIKLLVFFLPILLAYGLITGIIALVKKKRRRKYAKKKTRKQTRGKKTSQRESKD